MATDKINLGLQGETLAVFFLKKNGFNILETNFRTKFCEIDIIAKEDNTLCFIEVKTRTSLKKGLPKESVNPAKQKKIILGAQFYLKSCRLDNIRVRFDVVEIYVNTEKDSAPHIHIIKNAFWAV
ncbi:MAG: YraN family protein [Proteobacteria bacterium]|nr:YraN family protein [Pseudomonadota bacterium]MBU1389299.1 YraN family protein [Pseudomonadota bacterium]MBU1544119.1 YraN family protein [Pseudomonadota bacterium]MBU2431814.1 YraN family protein [Pseudomonadota bacterium]MBU2481621.1 YraN family protein [Pseudomonadota bacterium]